MQKETFIKQYAAGLNPQQLAAVQAVHGPVLLLAVPGSGKTTVLVTRLGYMVLCCDVPPAQILTMTYTVAATHEMRGRFAARFGAELAGQMTFRTINGLSAVILQYYSRVYGRRQPELLTNEGDITRMLTDIWQQVNREFPTESTLKELRTAIIHAKIFIPLLEIRQHRRRGPQNLQRKHHLVVVVHLPGPFQRGLVAAVQLRQVG